MEIPAIGSLLGDLSSTELIGNANDSGTVFSEIYKSAVELLDETNTLQKDAEQASIDFALGKTDNVHDVMIAQEKASIALQYTSQLRDSMLEAYNEIFRMQV